MRRITTAVPTPLRLLVIALPLYFAWEMVQMPAFTPPPEDLVVANGGVLIAAAAVALSGSMWHHLPREVERERDDEEPQGSRHRRRDAAHASRAGGA